MGIHAGEAVFGGRDYTGLDVHRTAHCGCRLGWSGLALGCGPCTCWRCPPGGFAFRDLGTHGLRDMPGPEHLYQLLAPGLTTEFPPLRTMNMAIRTNLPASFTRFVGRQREVDEVSALVDSQRLVTLTGPGGTGKTRLSIETARTLLDRFPDGVWFVALDSVRDPQLVVPTIAHTLGVREQPGLPMSAVLTERLAAEKTLLVLDNLEQVIAAAPDIASLLAATASVSILASSREPLSIGGERVYPVPPLAVPGDSLHPSAADLQGSGSIELFIERAQAVRPAFTMTDENAPAIAAICRRLDGLPLAIELAAARLNVLAPNQILSRLDESLTLLASSRRDLPDRQRTLRGTIDWSHDMLPEPERVLFRRMSVFTGGTDLETVQAVADPGHELSAGALDLVTALVDRSLLRSSDEGGVAFGDARDDPRVRR